MSKRILNADGKDDEEDQDLRNLLQKYIKRSEELEKRESQVMKQIETMQSAVASLQSWNRSRKSSMVSPDPERLDLNKIDDETRQIEEETRRIQKEVEEKIEENKRLQEEVDRRRSQRSEAMASGRQSRTLDPGGRSGTQSRGASGAESRPAQADAFQEKLRKLKDVERKLKNESEVQSEKNRKRQKDMEEKLEILELESKIDKQIIDSLQKKNKDKK